MRNMTLKGFLSKANVENVSADKFLNTHEAWIRENLNDSIEQLDSFFNATEFKGKIARECLENLKQSAFNKITSEDFAEAQKKLLANKIREMKVAERIEAEANGEIPATTAKSSSSRYSVSIMVGDDVIKFLDPKGKERELTKSFVKQQDAERWAYRRLFESVPIAVAVVTSLIGVSEKTGLPISWTLNRKDSAAMLAKRHQEPACKVKPKSTSRVGFGVSSKPDRCHFSHG